MVEASAPAKAILFGEHAVVYGQPAIAVPVSGLRAFATVQPNTHGLRITAADLDIPVNIDPEPVEHALALTARLVLKALNAAPPHATITIRSDIPIASGLGSGAAVSTALARALCAQLGRSLDNETLNGIIYEVEKIHHGTPSGIDNTVIVYERPIYFMRGQPDQIETMTIGRPFTLLIGDTGKGASTREAVAAVRALYESEPEHVQKILNFIGKLANQARTAIEVGDLESLGLWMSLNHDLLGRLNVSTEELDRLVRGAKFCGALGAKLSGGGRGGNMIALVTPETQEEVERGLRSSGAVHVFTTEVR